MASRAVMARTPTSVPGSEPRPCGAACTPPPDLPLRDSPPVAEGLAGRGPAVAPARTCAPAAAGGFTLVELLVVLVLIAIAAGTATLALRDGEAVRLEREAARLVALLEAARAEARASGVAVRFELRDGTFGFAGLPARLRPPEGWQAEGMQARIESPGQPLTGAGVALQAMALGPEPLIGAQRIVLQLGERQLVLATDGLAPFSVASGESGDAATSGSPATAGTR